MELKSKHFTVDGKGVTLHYLCVVGSKLHGVANESSDTDLKGVFTYDNEVLFGLRPLQETFEKGTLNKDNWEQLVNDLNKELQLDLTLEDDVVLFESKKFAVNALKSELNMLDMLTSNLVVVESKQFNELRKNAHLFLDFEQARKRFLGLSNNVAKIYLKSHKKKDLAKTVHSLFLFKQLVVNKKYNPRVENQDEFMFVVDTRNGLKSDEEVFKKQDELFSELNELVLPESTQDFDAVNDLVVGLNF